MSDDKTRDELWNDPKLFPGGAGTLNPSNLPSFGVVTELVATLRSAPFSAPSWLALAAEYERRGQRDELEICLVAVQYLFDPVPEDLAQKWLGVYIDRRVDRTKPIEAQVRSLTQTGRTSMAQTIAAVRKSKIRVEQELVAAINALEVDHGGV